MNTEFSPHLQQTDVSHPTRSVDEGLGGASLKDRDFEFACGVLDDDRSLIAAGKTQRWEVLKWTVTVNVGIAALLAARGGVGGILTVLAFIIAVIGIALIQHYNSRMTKARAEANNILSLFDRSGVNLDLIQPGWRDYQKHPDLKTYDWQELYAFPFMIGGSAFLPLLAWAFK
jgi:hypothetical protein